MQSSSSNSAETTVGPVLTTDSCELSNQETFKKDDYFLTIKELPAIPRKALEEAMQEMFFL
jgi:hypothetical protein